MRKRLSACLICLLLTGTTAVAQSHPLRILFYNVENLFDNQDDPEKEDNDYLPQSTRHWNKKKLRIKCEQIARVIAAAGEWNPPALVGLCEVENETALKHLAHYGSLRQVGYHYVMTQSDDVRGINVALLYRPDRFRLISSRSYRPHFPSPQARPTRDLLHVTGQTLTLDTLDLLICHLPSQIRAQSQQARQIVLTQMREKIDSLRLIRESMHLLIMGDFNAEMGHPDIIRTLEVQPTHREPQGKQLYSAFPSYRKHHTQGSYRYKGEWSLIDHIYLSGSLLTAEMQEAEVFAPSFLLEPDRQNGGDKPRRSWIGMKFSPSGFSDHLPIRFDLCHD